MVFGMKKKDNEKVEFEQKLKREAEKQLEAELAEAATSSPDDPENVSSDTDATETVAAGIDPLAVECEALKDRLLRLHAEFDNYRKRTARDAERLRRTAGEAIVLDLLPAVDNLERALGATNADDAGSLAEGVKMVLKQICDVLARHGLEPIAAVGEPFDPTVHEALTCVPTTDMPANYVCQEFQRGYRFGDHVVRPAKVAVTTTPPEPLEATEN